MTHWKITLINGRVADQVVNVTEGESLRVSLTDTALIITELKVNPGGERTQYDTLYPIHRVEKIERFGPAIPVKVPVPGTFQNGSKS